MSGILIRAFGRAFAFAPEAGEGAWYELDHAVSTDGGWSLALNADREVYAAVTEPGGRKHFGTVGDAENDVLADNYPFFAGETYFFYEKPETETFYV